MATLTLCKILGSPIDDAFRGTCSNPGDMPSEWDFLLRNSKLSDWNVKLRVIEAKDINSLDVPYKNQIKKTPYLNLQVVGGATVAYPSGSPLKERDIVTWVRNSVGDIPSVVDVEPPTLISVQPSKRAAPTVPVATATVHNKQIATDSAIVQNPPANPSLLSNGLVVGSVVSGSFFVVACAIAGAVAGFLISKDDSEYETEPLLLVGDDGKEVDFNDAWGQRGPTPIKSAEAPIAKQPELEPEP
jgi:hypothetical protein